MVDIAAKLKELRAKKALENAAANDNSIIATAPINTVTTENNNDPSTGNADNSNHLQSNSNETAVSSKTQETTGTLTIGTARTSEIDHLAFLSKHQELADCILNHHPKMPVLLMEIHKHLREDPELVTILTEEQIGTIVEGLKIQTKTELVGTIAKQAKSRDKKTKISLDML